MAASTALQVLVSPLLGTVFDNLSSLIRTEIGLVWGVNKELEKLSSTLSTIRDVLEDAELRQIKNKPICNWLRKLKNVAYDAEDVLDEFATEAALRSDHQIEVPGTNKGSNSIHEVLTNSVSSFFNLKQISFRRKIAKRIKELVEKFDEIANERSKFHFNTNLIPGYIESGEMHHRQTSSFLTEPQVFGREEDKEHIVNQLLNNTEVDSNDVSVCAILGMGGLGKTTLAQMVHHNDRIVKHFEIRCWVCVSEDFEPTTIFKAIIESSGGSTQDLQNIDPLQHRLREILGGKRFLVVLDDVWNEDQAKWESLKSSLSCGSKGSSIIITTRLDRVESITATLLTCRPKKLSDEDCWSLFKNRAFDMRHNEENHPTLEVIGKQIVEKCRGIPLAAKFLGGLLRFKRKDSEWVAVRDSDIWDLPQDKADAILPALRLSYEHLSLHLRQCFVYCTIFPKDYTIEREKLIHLWIANGFVQSAGQNMELEDVGDAIFNDLSCRSFFQDFKNNEDGNLSSCKMHDLVHDLASSIMRDECLVIEVGKERIVGTISSTNTRHLSLHYTFWLLSSKSSFLDISPHIRTLLLESLLLSYKPSPPLQLIFSRLKCLRALDLSHTDISTVPDSIGNLRHLRYLDLPDTEVTSLPNKPFCTLINLQTLKLNTCKNLRALPKDMWKLSSLRHLELRGCDSLRQTPVRMRKLICLQTLNIFIVKTKSGRGITELQELNCLSGELEIKGLEHVRNPIDARNANLMKKQNLHSLTLSWSEDDNSTTEEDVLLSVGENLQPLPCIKRLHIKGFGGATLPSWMRDFSSHPNLVEVSLIGCKRCERISSLGELRLLKVLKIVRMDSVKCIGDEFYSGDHHHQASVFFPSLEILHILFMPNLEEFSSPPSSSWSPSSSSSSLSNKLLAFPCLKDLIIENCPKLRRLISFPSSLEKLCLGDCNEILLSISLENLPATNCLSWLTIGLSEEVISFPKVERMTWMKLSNLTKLYINKSPKLKTLPKELLENLTALTHLHIERCDEFIHLPEGMQYLKSLREFMINDCGSLKSLHEGLRHLTTLEELCIEDCPELEFLPEDDDDFQHLISLQILFLVELRKMTSLPTVAGWSQEDNNLTSVPTLEHLYISYCSSLTTLPEWIPNLTSLRSLAIEDCKNLKSLPNEGFQRLTALKYLRISECHRDLQRRCEKDKGDDWHKISHIPRLEFND